MNVDVFMFKDAVQNVARVCVLSSGDWMLCIWEVDIDIGCRIWKDMSLNDSMTELERSKLAVWDYPVSDKHTKIWQSMQEAGLPLTFEEAIQRVRASGSTNDGFAFIGQLLNLHPHSPVLPSEITQWMICCV